MAGYTRQSTADIVAGEVVRAAPINNEFNQLEVAFGAISGHAHDGAAGNGARIDGEDLTGLVPIIHGGTGANTAAAARTALGVVIGSAVQAWNAILDSISVAAVNGFITRTAAGVVATRVITGTAAEVTVTNGDGVAGNPTLSLPAAMTMTGKTLTNGTYTGGTFSGTWSGALATSSATITGGSVTGITDIAIADGGTGASTAANARTNLGLGTIATQDANAVNLTGGTITGISVTGTIDTSSANITGGTITGITDLAIADGGTGASTAANARTNLGLVAVASSGSAADLSTGTLPSARLSGTYATLTGTGALTAGSINWTGQVVTTVGIQAGTTLSAGTTITSGGSITSGSEITTQQNYRSVSAATVIGPNSSGNVYLRPNGVGSSTSEFRVSNDGNAYMSGNFWATGVVYAASGGAYLGTDGNTVGSIWSNWGSSSAFHAISAQIEARAIAWRNDAIGNIMPTIAAQGAGNVGTYCFAQYGAEGPVPNTAANGASLFYASGQGGALQSVGGGSWRCMGRNSATATAGGWATLWLRYA